VRPVVGGLAVIGLLMAGTGCETKPPPAPAVETTTAAVQPAALTPEEKAPSGALRARSIDAARLLRPTTGAIRDGRAWVAIGQLTSLFGDRKPVLPFRVLSMPLAGGPIADSVELPGDYYPEGVTTSRDGTLYVGSIALGVVSKVAPDSTKAEPVVTKAGTRRGVIGLTVDETRGLLWFCDSDPTLPDAEKAGELVGVKLADASEVARHELPKTSATAPFCNDVIVSPDGALWITDSAVGRLLRVAPEHALDGTPAETWLAAGPLGPPESGGHGVNGLEWLDGTLVVSNVGRGTLTALDPASTEADRGARPIALTKDGQPETLCSPDGLARLPGSNDEIVVVENGGCQSKAPRVAVVKLML
jgi:hypothetical protein